MSSQSQFVTIVSLMTLILLPFQNCDSGSSSKSSSSVAGSFATAHAPTLAEIAGVWKGTCKPATSTTSYRTAIELYANGTMAIAIGVFQDSNCVTGASADAYTGTFTLGPSSVASAGQLLFTITGVSRTPVSAAAASGFNLEATCGYTAWAVNTPVSIAPGSSCLSIPANSGTLVGVSSNLLFLGNDTNTALDPADVYTKL